MMAEVVPAPGDIFFLEKEYALKKAHEVAVNNEYGLTYDAESHSDDDRNSSDCCNSSFYSCAENGSPIFPLLRKSRFSFLPSTVNFRLEITEVPIPKPKWDIRKKMLWSNNSILPKVLRKMLINHHFRIVKTDKRWLGYWGSHLKTIDYVKILPFQKVNHFPGNHNFGRKDRLAKNIRELAAQWPKEHFDFMPETFILPREANRLKSMMNSELSSEFIILKPPGSARGIGIKVINKTKNIPINENLVAQKYIRNPYLINGYKFDLRFYVLVTSFHPLRIYLYNEGIVRFAGCKYDDSEESLKNDYIHLTNFSINKNANPDDRTLSMSDLKWSFSKFIDYIKQDGADVNRLMTDIIDIILKTMISCERELRRTIDAYCPMPFVAYELYGFDILLDSDLQPWLLEVNISPSVRCITEVDKEVKLPLLRDVLNLAGVSIPTDEFYEKAKPYKWLCTEAKRHCFNLHVKPNKQNCCTEHILSKSLWAEKQFVCFQKLDENIFDDLTPYEASHLLEMEDEYDRRGGFVRLMPSTFSHAYLKYVSVGVPRYLNLMQHTWIQKYGENREAGCAFLENIGAAMFGKHFANQ
ncbi:Tubulin polyglutamylase ttll-4 [Trichinella sp. T9]|nr:Tubulin polyglutamylase ttll-4 [Trichinella sp. T9]